MGNTTAEYTQAESEKLNGGENRVKRSGLYGFDSTNSVWVRLAVNENGNLAGSVPTGVTSGRQTVATAGTAVQLIVASTTCVKVEVSADLGNTNPVIVGGSGVVAASDSQKGIVLIPGNDPFTITIDNVNKLWVDAQTNGDSVTFNYYT